MSTDVNTCCREASTKGNTDKIRGLLWWLDWLRWRGRIVVVFPDFVNDLQLGAKLLIIAEAHVVATLKHKLRIDGRQQDLRVRGQQILSLTDHHPVVIDQTARGGDRKIRRNLRRDLLE